MIMKITAFLSVCFCSVYGHTGNNFVTKTESVDRKKREMPQELSTYQQQIDSLHNGDVGLLGEKRDTAIADLLRRILHEERNVDSNNDNSNGYGLVVETLADSQVTRVIPTYKRIFHTSTHAKCDFDNHYRTMDGRCNNRNNPDWGSTNQPFTRWVNPSYDDGEFIPRLKDSNGNSLPSPRFVSLIVHPGMNKQSRDDTVMVMQWGQFLDHDITGTPVHGGKVTTKCCDNHDPETILIHNDVYNGGPCFPITLPGKDRHFTKRCMEFRRSAPAPNQSPREQLNTITAFIDGSAVYGSSENEINDLKNGAYLKIKGDNLLPESNVTNCRITNSDEWCFAAGDARANVFPGLSLLHTVFVREHNRLVNLLTSVLPANTPEDVLFQEARKIVSALLQQFTYDEWLPILLGPDAMKKYKLNINTGYSYNSTQNPTIANVFATAAFRYGHSEIPRFLRLGGRTVPIEDLFFRNTELIRDFDAVLESLLLDRRQQIDRFVTSGMTDHMFETSDQNSFDIVSLNIQRGRDHGLPPYNSFRRACNLPEVKSFQDDVFGRAGASLQDIHSSPDDIDIFTGSLCEVPVRGGSVGPLLVCLIGQQFHNLKFGDSFWYETKDSSKGFTQDQLNEIRRMSFAKVLCANSGIYQIQRNPFKMAAGRRNPVVSCDDLPTIDISKWRK